MEVQQWMSAFGDGLVAVLFTAVGLGLVAYIIGIVRNAPMPTTRHRPTVATQSARPFAPYKSRSTSRAA